jgi:hypothetical protein
MNDTMAPFQQMFPEPKLRCEVVITSCAKATQWQRALSVFDTWLMMFCWQIGFPKD